jgi:hypothetical protein
VAATPVPRGRRTRWCSARTVTSGCPPSRTEPPPHRPPVRASKATRPRVNLLS